MTRKWKDKRFDSYSAPVKNARFIPKDFFFVKEIRRNNSVHLFSNASLAIIISQLLLSRLFLSACLPSLIRCSSFSFSLSSPPTLISQHEMEVGGEGGAV